jgi:hypothetical protein
MTFALQELALRSTQPLRALRRVMSRVSCKLRDTLRARFGTKRKKKHGPDDGPDGAGVIAWLKPPPPVLIAMETKPFPPLDEERA